MLKNCDECGKSFDIFNEGKGHELFVVCGNCWANELSNRKGN